MFPKIHIKFSNIVYKRPNELLTVHDSSGYLTLKLVWRQAGTLFLEIIFEDLFLLYVIFLLRKFEV